MTSPRAALFSTEGTHSESFGPLGGLHFEDHHQLQLDSDTSPRYTMHVSGAYEDDLDVRFKCELV